MPGLTLSSPVTGATQTGLTSPTYTVTADTAPSPNGKQVAVTALGGTQTGVNVHSTSVPFTNTFFRPQQTKTLPAANPVTGVIKNIPNNVYKAVTRHGVYPAANIPAIPMPITTTIPVPAGADTYDLINVKAALSLHIGALNQLSAEIGASCGTGII